MADNFAYVLYRNSVLMLSHLCGLLFLWPTNKFHHRVEQSYNDEFDELDDERAQDRNVKV